MRVFYDISTSNFHQRPRTVRSRHGIRVGHAWYQRGAHVVAVDVQVAYEPCEVVAGRRTATQACVVLGTLPKIPRQKKSGMPQCGTGGGGTGKRKRRVRPAGGCSTRTVLGVFLF